MTSLWLAMATANLLKPLDLVLDGSSFGLGNRSERYAMIVEDRTVTKLAVEGPGKFEVSNAESILDAL